MMKIYFYQNAYFKYFLKVLFAILISNFIVSTNSTACCGQPQVDPHHSAFPSAGDPHGVAAPLQDGERLTANEAKFVNSENSQTVAEILAINNKADKLWQQGKVKEAIALWQSLASIYRERGLVTASIETTFKIATGYSNLGQLELAQFYLQETLSQLETDSSFKARVWEQLGNVSLKKGELDGAIAFYQESLAIDRSLSTINNLAIAHSRDKFRSQLKAQSARIEEKSGYLAEAQSSETERKNLLKQAISLLSNDKPASSLRTLIEWAKSNHLTKEQLIRGRKFTRSLPNSRNKIFLILDWAKTDLEQKDRWLKLARQEARNDERVLSYVYLEKGLSSFQAQKYDTAKADLSRAIAFGSRTNNYEALYRAFWLSALIERKTGSDAVAMDYYRDAIASLTNYLDIKSNFDEEQRLDFAKEIEPLYREALQLLLIEPEKADLLEAIAIAEKLRKAQLQQFFGDNCNLIAAEEVTPEYLETENAVLLTSIVEDEATHLILQLPNEEILYHKSRISQADLEKLGSDWYYQIIGGLFEWKPEVKAERLYDLILRPFEASIDQLDNPTIVFVHDGILRNLPMAALYDGEKFLAQKWASLSSIGLKFVPEDTFTIENSDFLQLVDLDIQGQKLVAFGLGLEVAGWSPLDHVGVEITEIVELIGGEKILNRQFTEKRFANELKEDNTKIVHLATHGYFGGVAENSYLLTYDGPMTAHKLEDVLSPQVDLLVMSACETALNSDRSTLGLAGLALRNNVKSVVGTYWQVEDKIQSQIMVDFYAYLEAGLNVASALQKVQSEQITSGGSLTDWASLNLIVNL